jgi:small-conductance mechanosensitive channel
LREQTKVRTAYSVEKVRALTVQLEARSSDAQRAADKVVELKAVVASLQSSERIIATESAAEWSQLVAQIASRETASHSSSDVTHFTAQIADLTSKLSTLKQQSKTRAAQSIDKIMNLKAQLAQTSREALDQVAALEASLQAAQALREASTTCVSIVVEHFAQHAGRR